jgi:uncharacterized caspase-like protein/Tfp pilus assembly protein PilF
MHLSTIFYGLIIRLLISFLPFISAANAQSAKTNTYAVVVGISQYESRSIPALQFADNDAQLFSEFLQSPSGGNVPEGNIRLLINEQATFAAIYTAMYALIDEAGKNDRVFFYFSGHGDVEHITAFGMGFLLAYNTPPNNYINHAVRIEDLNDVANTLSSRNKASVILITDACRSGKLAGDLVNGRQLVGKQLRDKLKNEVRIASCGNDELSAENAGWGGGRGVFSYYLLNGLYGLADAGNNAEVNTGELSNYLQQAFATDEILKRDKHKQTPVIEGNNLFVLAKTDAAKVSQLKKVADADIPEELMIAGFTNFKTVGLQPLDYFSMLFNELKMEEVYDFKSMETMAVNALPQRLIDGLAPTPDNGINSDSLQMVIEQLESGALSYNRFNETVAMLISNRGQQIINAYLQGDQAELEKRNYYNIKKGTYDQFVSMYNVALRLLTPGNPLYKAIMLDRSYFEGVVWRLKIPTVQDPRTFINNAFRAQFTAMAQDSYVAYVHNELANLYITKRNFDSAAYHFTIATDLAPTWAIPWANRVAMYNVMGNYTKAQEASAKAEALQPGLVGTLVNKGITAEKLKNYLDAEGLQQRSIQKNRHHFLPYQRLGMLYTATARYAMADSFLYEANKRKEGFYFGKDPVVDFNFFNPTRMNMPKPWLENCMDNYTLPDYENDVNIFLFQAKKMWGFGDAITAEKYFIKALEISPSWFLLQHEYGKFLIEQKAFIRAEPFILKARQGYQDYDAHTLYVNQWKAKYEKDAVWDCIGSTLISLHYPGVEDAFLLAFLYEIIGYRDEAAGLYREIGKDSLSFFTLSAQQLLANTLFANGQYKEAEQEWKTYGNKIEKLVNDSIEFRYSLLFTAGNGNWPLENFYEKMLELYPKDGYWYKQAGAYWHQKISGKPLDYIFTDESYEQYNEGLPKADLDAYSNAGFQKQLVKSSEYEWLGARLAISEPILYPHKKAIQVLNRAAMLQSSDEDFITVNNWLGDLYRLNGNVDSAVYFYRVALNTAPENASLRQGFATILQETNYLFESYQVWDTLHQQGQLLFANMPWYVSMATYAHQWDAAANMLTRLQQSPFIHKDSLALLKGNLYFMKTNTRQSIAYTKDSLQNIIPDGERYYRMAALYATSRQQKDAFTWLEKSLKNGFTYGHVLKYDPVWNNYSESGKWKKIVAKYEKGFKKYMDGEKDSARNNK